jgi:putative ABC transport system ATP-binding protein
MVILKVENIKKSYRTPDGDRQEILDIPLLEIEDDDHVAIRGASGSGKTTFLNIIAGIVKPDSGSVFLHDTEVTSLRESRRDRFRAANIGYIFQTFNLIQGLTALENVALGAWFGSGNSVARSREMLERVGLGNRLHYYPRALSVGQQQRVAVARALVNKPRLVIADEPTGNLDPDFAREAMTLIREQCTTEKAELLLVSHDPRILDQFDTVIPFESINRAFKPSPVTA